MLRRPAAAIVGGVLAVLAAALPGGAASDGTWDYRSVSISGTYTPIVGNFDLNTTKDVLWYAPGTAADSLWLSKPGERASFTKVSLRIGGLFVPVAGDFAGDARTDILWYAPGAAADYLWTADDSPGRFSSRSVSISGRFRPVVLRDFRASDPKDDLFLYAAGTAADYLWRFADDGSGARTSVPQVVNGTFTPIVGRWNGDLQEDIVWYGTGSAPDALWLATSTGSFSRRPLSVGGTYAPVRIIRDAAADGIYWYGRGPARDAMWNATAEGGFTNVPTGQVDWYCEPYEGTTNSTLLHCANNPEVFVDDSGSTSNTFRVSASRDLPRGFRPLLGDLDGDAWLDIFWYAAGPTSDQLWYTVPPAAAVAPLGHARHS